MSQGPEIDLSAFTDIMTCILGVLVLIILLTGIDASQIAVLVATPKEMASDDKSPVFFECRNQQLFYISSEDLKEAVDAKTEELRAAVGDDQREFLKQAAQTMIEVNGQKVDYTMALMGKYELIPIPEAQGYELSRSVQETDQTWFGSKLATIDPKTQFVCFFVRPDSFRIFQRARTLAWLKNINVACELQDEKNHIILGPGGSQIFSQ